MEGMPVPPALPAIGEEIAGKYRVESVLGQGGMGAVFSARNTLTGKRVAIKWLLPEQSTDTSRERLLREARIAASIEHPNVVDIYDVGEHQGGLFLVMEYLRGQTLADLLAQRGRFDPEELITVLVPAMRGVHSAHQAGVVHRDLKPENIILSEIDGHIVPKVVDFGVSKATGPSSVPHSTLTRTGALVGTPHYMALEQVDGSGAIDARTDIYAFGVILYRSLTGHYPFDGSSLGEVILKIGTKDAQPMRLLRTDLPPDLDDVVARALSRNRDARFRDIEQMARALEPFARGVRFRDTVDATQPFAVSSTRGIRIMTPPETTPSEAALRGPAVAAAPTPQRLPSEQIADIVTGSVHRSRARALVLGAVFALFLLAGFGFWALGTQEEIASPQAPALPQLPASFARPHAALPSKGEPQAATPADSLPARQEQPSPAPVHEPIEVDPATDTTSTAAAEPTTLAPEPERVAPSKREKSPKGSHVRGPRIIPGDRTKGLSVDDF